MPTKKLYFIAIIPDGRVKAEVQAFKQEVAERFGSKAALRSPPHITLHMPFEWQEAKEAELKQKLSGFKSSQLPLKVDLNGFGFFEPRVVFVDVAKNEALNNLQKELVGHVRRHLNILNANYKDQAFHPHMTIGFRDLKKSRFQEVREYYNDRVYEASFEVSSICLLKHNGKTWDEWFYF